MLARLDALGPLVDRYRQVSSEQLRSAIARRYRGQTGVEPEQHGEFRQALLDLAAAARTEQTVEGMAQQVRQAVHAKCSPSDFDG